MCKNIFFKYFKILKKNKKNTVKPLYKKPLYKKNLFIRKFVIHLVGIQPFPL